MGSNLVRWIEESLASDETVIGVVIGEYGWGRSSWEQPGFGEETVIGEESVISPIPWDKRGIVLTWAEARPLLDYFDAGYGSPGCHHIYVWTTQRVLFISQYDGSTSLESVPRDPVACRPVMPGV